MKSPFEQSNPSPDEEQRGAAEEREESAEELREVAASADSGIVNKIRKFINSKVQESKLPTKEGLGYESTMGVYGGKLAHDDEGRLVYDTRGLWSKIDQWGDRVLRSFDEHHARQPGKMFLRNPKRFLKMLPFVVDSKRYRGTPDQTMENVRRFGLEEYYGNHPWGIEIKQPDVLSHSIGLQDIFRQDQIDSPAINDIDRFEALGGAADYMKKLHDTAGGIAEGNTYSFLFTKKEGNTVSEPIIMVPTEIYNPEKNISDVEKKATDLLDLLASSTFEEYRRSGKDWESVNKALDTVLSRYQDEKVIRMVASYIKRGRLTLPGDIDALEFEHSPTYRVARKGFAAHNTQRLSANPDISAEVRDRIVEACERHVAKTGDHPENASEQEG